MHNIGEDKNDNKYVNHYISNLCGIITYKFYCVNWSIFAIFQSTYLNYHHKFAPLLNATMELPIELVEHIMSYIPENGFLVSKRLTEKYFKNSTRCIQYRFLNIPGKNIHIFETETLFPYELYVKWLTMKIYDMDSSFNSLDFTQFKNCFSFTVEDENARAIILNELDFDFDRVKRELISVTEFHCPLIRPEVALSGIEFMTNLRQLNIKFLVPSVRVLNQLPNLIELNYLPIGASWIEDHYENINSLMYIQNVNICQYQQRDVNQLSRLFPRLSALNASSHEGLDGISFRNLELHSLVSSGLIDMPISVQEFNCTSVNGTITIPPLDYNLLKTSFELLAQEGEDIVERVLDYCHNANNYCEIQFRCIKIQNFEQPPDYEDFYYKKIDGLHVYCDPPDERPQGYAEMAKSKVLSDFLNGFPIDQANSDLESIIRDNEAIWRALTLRMGATH